MQLNLFHDSCGLVEEKNKLMSLMFWFCLGWIKEETAKEVKPAKKKKKAQETQDTTSTKKGPLGSAVQKKTNTERLAPKMMI